MTLVQTISVGRLKCHTLHAGTQHLDGGAMFGVVPKALWQKRIPADDRNRIPLAMRCLLVEHDDGLVLVDTGLGNKESDKFMDMYGVENVGADGLTQLEDAIGELGYTAGDVAMVINTHLHFDHAGGNTRRGPGDLGMPIPSFPNATYVVQRGELEFALHPNERTAGSYFAQNIVPVTEAGAWTLLDGSGEVCAGIDVVLTPGHVPYHQSVIVSDGGETLCFVADLVPTTAHIPLPWIMAYDLEPLVTMEEKRKLLAKATSEEWIMVFVHDPVHGVGRVVRSEKGYGFLEGVGSG